MRLKFILFPFIALLAVSCANLRQQASLQRFADGIYFNGRTVEKKRHDYVPCYKSSVADKRLSVDYSPVYAGCCASCCCGVFLSIWDWYDWRYRWDPWYGPWYYPWYGPYGPGWGPWYPYDPGWYPWRPVYVKPSTRNPVGGNVHITPSHSGGMGSFTHGAGGSYYRQGSGNSGTSGYRRGAAGSEGTSYHNGAYHINRGVNPGTAPSGSYNRGGSGGSFGGGSHGGAFGGGSHGGSFGGGGGRRR